MSISSKLTQLASIKSDIKTAIINKGQTVDDDMTAYAEAIDNIQSGGLNYVETSATTLTPVWNTCYQWTSDVTSLTISAPSAPEDSTQEILLKFTTGTSASISFPSAFKWANQKDLEILDGYTYEVSLTYDMTAGVVTAMCSNYSTS